MNLFERDKAIQNQPHNHSIHVYENKKLRVKIENVKYVTEFFKVYRKE